jgi:hypothetical protein
MRHMRFLFLLRPATKPDKDLTEEVGGLFPRGAEEIKISILGSQAVRGEFSLDGRPDPRENRCALAISAIKSREKVGFTVGATAAFVVWALRKRGDAQTVRKQGFAPEAIVPDKLRSDDALDSETHALVGKFQIGQIFFRFDFAKARRGLSGTIWLFSSALLRDVGIDHSEHAYVNFKKSFGPSSLPAILAQKVVPR